MFRCKMVTFAIHSILAGAVSTHPSDSGYIIASS